MLKQPDITMNAATCCFSIGLYIIYTDEVLSCLGTPYINCVYDLYYVYSHFENQLEIINIKLGHAMFNVTRSRLFLPTFPNK